MPQQEEVMAVVALAGRRIDAPGADPPRFPLAHVARVRQRLAGLLRAERATALVCSAACGADLVALEAAEQLGLRRRIVLPFAADRFLRSSVLDRPGDWAGSFDRLIAAAAAAGDLIVLDGNASKAAYAAANAAIIREAQALARGDGPRRLLAVTVWEGEARTGSDATDGFRQLAMAAGFEDRSVSTL